MFAFYLRLKKNVMNLSLFLLDVCCCTTSRADFSTSALRVLVQKSVVTLSVCVFAEQWNTFPTNGNSNAIGVTDKG